MMSRGAVEPNQFNPDAYIVSAAKNNTSAAKLSRRVGTNDDDRPVKRLCCINAVPSTPTQRQLIASDSVFALLPGGDLAKLNFIQKVPLNWKQNGCGEALSLPSPAPAEISVNTSELIATDMFRTVQQIDHTEACASHTSVSPTFWSFH